jgi:hypothetical protein
MGVNLINRPEIKPDDSTIWVQIAHVLPEQKEEINKEWFFSFPAHQLSPDAWWDQFGKFGFDPAWRITQD